jgi:putative flippase GtrA
MNTKASSSIAETGRTLVRQPLIRYIIVGGSVYVLELAIIVLVTHLGGRPTIAVTYSFFIGLIVSFMLQKLFTFGDKRTNHKIIFMQIMAVSLLVLFNYGFTICMTWLLQDVIPVAAIRTITLIITTVWNFYLYRTRIFAKT